jgi:TetR/AcrR family transcriptional repressor of bet genes
MPRASNTDERRRQIARAFVKVMAHHGYDGASIAEVARRAKLAPGLVHYHFENKLEILLAAMREVLAEHAALLDAELRRAAGATGDPAAELAAFLDVHLGLGAHSNPDALAFWIQLGGEAQRQRKVRGELAAALTATAERLVEILRRGAARRVFRCPEPAAAAAALLALVEGYFSLATAARPLVPSGSAAGCAQRMAEGLLGCKLPAPRRPRPPEAP